MTASVIRIVGLASGVPSPYDDKFLLRYEPEAHDGLGEVFVTEDKRDALHFVGPREAFTLWRTIPNKRPLRSDGAPNRPMTAFTISIEPAGVRRNRSGASARAGFTMKTKTDNLKLPPAARHLLGMLQRRTDHAVLESQLTGDDRRAIAALLRAGVAELGLHPHVIDRRTKQPARALLLKAQP